MTFQTTLKNICFTSNLLPGIAPLTDCINNPIYQELPEEDKYFSSSGKRIYLDLRDSMGYTNEMENLSRNNLKITAKNRTKNSIS